VEVLKAVSGMAALFVPWLAYRLHKPDRVAEENCKVKHWGKKKLTFQMALRWSYRI
jgi:hypothetical protein